MIRRTTTIAALLLVAGAGDALVSGDASPSKERHWAYMPLRAPAVPAVRDEDWPRSPIDRFVLARLEREGMTPSPAADRYTVIRRLSFDLRGLPPAPEEADAFARDPSPFAYERLVERLLASPAFGERWGRHWLDKARYADSDGYEKDNPRPDAWRYRDWVIAAINDDLPYDDFSCLQLAGDLLSDRAPDLPAAARETKLLATAFHRQTLTNTEGGTDQEQFRIEAVFDRVSTTATVWLGLTAGCAQCHDHKYDRLSQKEFYQLFAFFDNADETTAKVPVASGAAAAAAATTKAGSGEKPGEMDVRVLTERRSERRETRLLHRGDFLQPREVVEADGLEVLPPLLARGEGPPDRLDLVNWLFAQENPLPPRVAANHVWSRLFGRGIVATADDFGVRGEPPTHPELLDWLAREYRRLDWSRKALVRTIVLSATYRQGSREREEYGERDPENRLLSRQNRFRLEGEILRDAALSAGGLLVRRIGGASVFPPMPPEIAELSYAGNFKWTASEGADRYRRGLYTFFKRTAPHPNLTTFDCPDANTTCTERQISNTPLQALTLLNNEVFVDAALALARRIATGNENCSRDERIVRAFRLCVTRPPAETERRALAKLLAEAETWFVAHPEAAREAIGAPKESDARAIASSLVVARVLLNLDEFVTRE